MGERNQSELTARAWKRCGPPEDEFLWRVPFARLSRAQGKSRLCASLSTASSHSMRVGAGGVWAEEGAEAAAAGAGAQGAGGHAGGCGGRWPGASARPHPAAAARHGHALLHLRHHGHPQGRHPLARQSHCRCCRLQHHPQRPARCTSPPATTVPVNAPASAVTSFVVNNLASHQISQKTRERGNGETGVQSSFFKVFSSWCGGSPPALILPYFCHQEVFH